MLNLIDVGAIGGLEFPWSKSKDRINCILSFEPNSPSRIQPQEIQLDTAVWNSDGEEILNIYGRGGTGSSLLTQNYEWVEENEQWLVAKGSKKLVRTWLKRAQSKGTIKVRTQRLDAILSNLRREHPDVPTQFHFLKSDTQSGEFFVIDGARRFLSEEALGAELELYRYPLYRGMVLENDVKALMGTLGFDVAGSTEYKNSFLSQADVLFLKREDLCSTEDKRLLDEIRSIYSVNENSRRIKQMTLLERISKRAANALQSIRPG